VLWELSQHAFLPTHTHWQAAHHWHHPSQCSLLFKFKLPRLQIQALTHSDTRVHWHWQLSIRRKPRMGSLKLPSGTHTPRAEAGTWWEAAPLSRPRPVVYIHMRVADSVQVGLGTHATPIPWVGAERGGAPRRATAAVSPTHPHTQGWSEHMLGGSTPVPPPPHGLHT
jgi:hypothetical protein